MSRLHQYYQPMGWAKMRRLPLMARVMSLERPPRRIPNAWIGSSEDSALGSQGCGQNPGTTEMKGFVHLQKQLETFLFLGNCKGGLSKSKHVQTNMLHYCTICECIYRCTYTSRSIFKFGFFHPCRPFVGIPAQVELVSPMERQGSPGHIFPTKTQLDVSFFWQVDGLWSCFLVAWSLHGLKGYGLAALFSGVQKEATTAVKPLADFRVQQRASKKGPAE